VRREYERLRFLGYYVNLPFPT